MVVSWSGVVFELMAASGLEAVLILVALDGPISISVLVAKSDRVRFQSKRTSLWWSPFRSLDPEISLSDRMRPNPIGIGGGR